MLPAGRAGRARGRVPRRRRRHARRGSRAIDDAAAHARCDAERAFLAELGGGCDLPCRRARARRRRDGRIALDALLAAPDGHIVLRTRVGDAIRSTIGAAAARDLARRARAARGARSWRRSVVTVYLVGAGPGDPGLLTRRGEELLRAADVVVYDRLASPALLDSRPRAAELVDVGKAPGRVAMTQDADQRGARRARTRRARTSCGSRVATRSCSGAAARRPRRARRAASRSKSCPASRARSRRAAYAGIPVTHRGRLDALHGRHRPRGSGQGPAPTPTGTRSPRAGGTLVILMGAGRIARDRRGVDRRRSRRRHAGRRGALGHAARATHDPRARSRTIADAGRRVAERDRRRRRRRARLSAGSSSARCSVAASS